MGIKKGLTHAPEEMSELKNITLMKNFKKVKVKLKTNRKFQRYLRRGFN